MNYCQADWCNREELHDPHDPPAGHRGKKFSIREWLQENEARRLEAWQRWKTEQDRTKREAVEREETINAGDVAAGIRFALDQAGYTPKHVYQTEAGETIRIEWICPNCNGVGWFGNVAVCTTCDGRAVVSWTYVRLFDFLIRKRVL